MEISLNELPLDFTAASHTQSFIHQIRNKVVVGYLSYDEDCRNPIEDCDGEGSILQSDYKEQKGDINFALGLDSSDTPDLSLLAKKIVAQLTKDEVDEWIEQYVDSSSDQNRKSLVDALENTEYWQLSSQVHCAYVDEIWEEEIGAGNIGNPYAVLLDKYEHSGVSWSVRSILSDRNPDGVWIPDEYAKEMIMTHEAVYAFGEIIKLHGPTPYHAKLDDGTLSAGFEEAYQAFAWLKNHVGNQEPTAEQRRIGQRRAAISVAEQALEQFNRWLAGDCYGIVCATFENIGDEEDPVWELVSSEECWGFVGSEYAEEEVKALAFCTAEKLNESNVLPLAA